MSAGTGPRYRLHEALGEGGMGVVHLGTQVSAAGERLVAIKRLRRAEVDSAARARLVAEAQLVFQLTYANICQVLDLGESEAGTFVVMEYVRGDDLAGLLARVEAGGGRLDVATAVYIAREVARALDYAHRRKDARGQDLGLVHGDVKPPNILLSVEGEVKLADFGIARALGTSAPGTGLLAGTPGFMAPEVARGGLDHRADIYSLGATLFRALLGRAADVPSADLLEDVPRDLRDLVARAIAVLPGARWLSAAELERALSHWLARRHPEFTPSLLADLVRRHALEAGRPARLPADTPEGATQVIDMHTLLESGPREAPPGKPRTATAAVAPRRWPRVLVPLVLVAGVTTWALWPARPPAPAAVLEVVDAAPPAPPAPDAMVTRAPSPAEPAPRRVRPRPAPPPAAPSPTTPVGDGHLTVNATPWGRVFVDGKQVADETPVYRLRVPAGRHEVFVRFGDDDSRSAAQQVTIEAGAHRTLGFRR